MARAGSRWTDGEKMFSVLLLLTAASLAPVFIRLPNQVTPGPQGGRVAGPNPRQGGALPSAQAQSVAKPHSTRADGVVVVVAQVRARRRWVP